MQTNVAQRLVGALGNPPWLERAWKLLTLDLGQWLIAHAPRAQETSTLPSEPAQDAVELASRDSFPASDPPGWISSYGEHEHS